MLAAATRIVRGVEVPVTVDAEAGYGLAPDELVAALRAAGAAGCNLEDTDYATGGLRDPTEQAEWLTAVRQAARRRLPLVINARIDNFVWPYLTGARRGTRTIWSGRASSRQRLPRRGRRLRLPDPPLGAGRPAPLHG